RTWKTSPRTWTGDCASTGGSDGPSSIPTTGSVLTALHEFRRRRWSGQDPARRRGAVVGLVEDLGARSERSEPASERPAHRSPRSAERRPIEALPDAIWRTPRDRSLRLPDARRRPGVSRTPRRHRVRSVTNYD